MPPPSDIHPVPGYCWMSEAKDLEAGGELSPPGGHTTRPPLREVRYSTFQYSTGWAEQGGQKQHARAIAACLALIMARWGWWVSIRKKHFI